MEQVMALCRFVKSTIATILATNQGSVRRGAASVNINIEHDDFEEWLRDYENPKEMSIDSLSTYTSVLSSVINLCEQLRQEIKLLDANGASYYSRNVKLLVNLIFYLKEIQISNNPEAYKDNALKVHMTNICSEIVLHTDESHSFVCCLSSLNLAKYDEWRNTNLIYDSIWFLDGVLEEFIQRAKYRYGFENAVRSAEKGRALGLGVLGWHTYLQEKGLPFEGLPAQFETRKIFSQIKIESERASRSLAETYGEPLWCRGTGLRNTHLRAVAPTVSNSKLSGNVSPGIEPWAANVFTEQTAKGTFIRKNPTLLKLLRKHKLNNEEIWNKILADGGSIQNISELDDITIAHDIPVKEVFKTFKEINQLELVNQAGIRQQYIDQSVSLNLAFPSQATPKWINKVHMEAWKKGIKTLYYVRTESVLRGDIADAAMSEDCLACDG